MQITSATDNSLIQKTRIGSVKDLRRFYNADCKHSLWNSLPIPNIQNIKHIAYVSPVDIIRHAFAFGTVAFDDIPVTPVTPETSGKQGCNQGGKEGGKQHYAADSKAVHNLVRIVQEAQTGNGDYRIMLAWSTDWRDGFGTNRNKNNRKSVVAWTFSVSPAKDSVNSGKNTFAMALGQKKNTAWPEVEQRVREDTSIFGHPKKPLLVYHGGLRKMVRVFVARINSCHDKPERADITATLACTSNNHRCFGKLVHIQTPTCDARIAEDILSKEHPNNNALEWGWSEAVLSCHQDNNRTKLSSCWACRARRVHTLLGFYPQKDGTMYRDCLSNVHCATCADWTLDTTTFSKLIFPASSSYPKTQDPDCPVEPPAGRCTTAASLQSTAASLQSTNEPNANSTCYLRPIDIHFGDLVKASKFAFYHVMTNKKQYQWNKSIFTAYMNANGIPL